MIRCREASGQDQCGFVGVLLHLCRMMEESAEKNHEYAEWIWEGQKKEGLTKEEEQKYVEFKLKNEEISNIDESDGYDFTNIYPFCWNSSMLSIVISNRSLNKQTHIKIQISYSLQNLCRNNPSILQSSSHSMISHPTESSSDFSSLF